MFTARKIALVAVVLPVLWGVGCGGASPAEPPEGQAVGRVAAIKPDYVAVTVPPNVAPLNFRVAEPGRRYYVRLRSGADDGFAVAARSPDIVLPPAKWRKLLEASRGGDVSVEVCVQVADGRWLRFEPFTMHVALEEMDRYIVYRQLGYVYMFWGRMRLRQRDLETYENRVLLDNNLTGDGCMNCHTFMNCSADKVAVQVRSGSVAYGHGMVLIDNGQVVKVDTKTPQSIGLAAFSSWHPSGRAVAYSMNTVRQFFHSLRSEVREAYDLKSDLALYLLDEGRVTSTAAICRPGQLEVWPAWSADGKHLYFSNAPIPWPEGTRMPPPGYDELRYDLVRIPYDLDTDTWGELETVLSAEDAGGSITQPRPSPDGRFLVCCMSDHSVFPTFETDADLFLLDLTSGRFERLACNSDQAESWHSWSSNSRWLVFSSKQGDGVFIRPFFAHIDESGRAAKPFVLPQKDPAFYDSFCWMYQLPEFVTDPIPLTQHQLARAIRYDEWYHVAPPTTGASPAAGASDEGEGTDTGLPWHPR